MSSSNAPQQPYEPAPQEEPDQPQPAGGPSLDDVVRETLDAQGGGDRLAPEVRRAFTEVARRHAAHETLELPIVEELVDAVLMHRFDQFRAQPELRAAATRRIAETLWEDTPARARLDRLWNTLRESSP